MPYEIRCIVGISAAGQADFGARAGQQANGSHWLVDNFKNRVHLAGRHPIDTRMFCSRKLCLELPSTLALSVHDVALHAQTRLPCVWRCFNVSWPSGRSEVVAERGKGWHVPRVCSGAGVHGFTELLLQNIFSFCTRARMPPRGCRLPQGLQTE